MAAELVGQRIERARFIVQDCSPEFEDADRRTVGLLALPAAPYEA